MKKLCLQIAIIASLIGLLMAGFYSLKLILVMNEILLGLGLLFVACPMAIANILVYAHVHDILPDEPINKSFNSFTSPKKDYKTDPKLECNACGMRLREGACPNCGS